MRQGAAQDVKHHAHLAADHVVERRTRTLVGDVGDLHPHLRVEQLACQVLRCAVARRGEAQRRFGLLGQRDQFLDALDAQVRMDFKHQRERRDLHDRRQIGHRVEGHAFVERGVHRHRAAGRQQQGVAVGRGLLGDFGAAQVAAGAPFVVHHHGHAQAFGQLTLQQTRHQVGRAAGRVGHHKADGLAGPAVLRLGSEAGGAQQAGEGGGDKGSALHGWLLLQMSVFCFCHALA